ncbi:MAG: hypothetical protein Q9203_005990 [Teloschistes exilis]
MSQVPFCLLKSHAPHILGLITHTWHGVDPDPVILNRSDCLVPKDLPSHLRDWIEHTNQVPKGYAVFEDVYKSYKRILVPEADIILRDRYFSRGDVVKKNPLNAQSGTVIGNVSELTLLPRLRVTRSDPGGIHTIMLPTHNFRPITGVKHREVRPYYRWNPREWIVWNDWAGTIRDVVSSITVIVPGGAVVVLYDPDDVEAYVNDLVDLTAFEPFVSPKKRTKEGQRLMEILEFYPGQRIRMSRETLFEGNWIRGAYDPTMDRHGIILKVQSMEIDVDWKRPNIRPGDGGLGNFSIPPPTTLDADLFRSGDITVYDPSRNLSTLGATQSEDIYETVHSCTAVGDCVVIEDTTVLENVNNKSPKIDWDSLQINPSASEGMLQASVSDRLISTVIATSTTVKVRWQDHTITEEQSTSLWPYTEVDDHDVWPGELVSLKDQEESSSSPEFERLIRTRMIGIVQSVNATERVARIRWLEGADVTITGQSADELVWAHSTFGNPTDRITENSLYELANHFAIVKRRGDTVCINRLGGINRSDPSAVTSVIQSPTASSVSPANGGIDWFGEILDLTLDGRLVVRLAALEHVQDVVVDYMDLAVVGSADDDSTDESMPDTDEPGLSAKELYERMTGLRPSTVQVATTTSIEYDGPTPSETDDLQWLTDSDDEDSTSHESPLGEGLGLDLGQTEDPQAEMVQYSPQTEADKRPEKYDRLESLPQPDSFEILDGEAPLDFFCGGAPAGAHSSAPLRAIQKEHRILQSSLPESVYVRTWESSLDKMRVLIIGPLGTPYALAPFLFDVHLYERFPKEPPRVFFHSWTNVGRVNPNLYEDGKVCLSLLGTWHSEKNNEMWQPNQSSILQVIVSLLGLVLVKEPFYNEAGFEALQDAVQSKHTSALYSEKAFVLSREFVKTAISSDPRGFSDVVRWLYLPAYNGRGLLRPIVEDCRAFLQQGGTVSTEAKGQDPDSYHLASTRLSLGALSLLKKILVSLEEALDLDDKLAVARSQGFEDSSSESDPMEIDEK